MKCFLLGLVFIFFISCSSDKIRLINQGTEMVKIEVLSSEEAIHLAADDLITDFERKAGNQLSRSLESSVYVGVLGDFKSKRVYSKVRKDLEGKWESYQVLKEGIDLYIIGSDVRGTMWGIYDFSNKVLGTDPMYIWTDKKPEQEANLVFDNINISAQEPKFKFRGWFINDEDYLTEWKKFDGRRNNDYKYYAHIIHPDISDKIIETALRLKMNLIIPSSFNDILNEPERYAIEKASQRGLLVTQHHIEPLGVGGFNFDDYFEKEGKEVPLFSYMKNPKIMEEVWTTYVKEWSKNENVLWQLGLRGRGDRPMWNHDPSIPKDNKSRGKLISDAINFQYNLVKSYDKDAFMTLTLWLEMSGLMQQGYIDIPDDIMIVFADNSPGWGFPPVFYDFERDLNKSYGIYYHHQLWSSGPHFIQGVPPYKTYEVVNKAVDLNSDDYCVLNVGNVREFVLGLRVSSEMLFNYESFDLDNTLDDWFEFYYNDHSYAVKDLYQDFFNHYLLDSEDKFRTGNDEMPYSPYLLDGHLAGINKRLLTEINYTYGLPEFESKVWILAAEFASKQKMEWTEKDQIIQNEIEKQKKNLTPVIEEADSLYPLLEGHPAYFFDVNLRTPAKMFYLLMDCSSNLLLAEKAHNDGDINLMVAQLSKALNAMKTANRIKKSMLQGKWEGWFDGEYKIRFSSYESYLEHIIKNLEMKITE